MASTAAGATSSVADAAGPSLSSSGVPAQRPASSRRRPPVAPHFVVAVVNDTTILRCVVSAGAESIESDPARLPVHTPAPIAESNPPAPTGRSQAGGGASSGGSGAAAQQQQQHQPPPATHQRGFLRVLLYSPNLVADDYPSFAWDADIELDNSTTFFLGSVRRRCEVIEKRFLLPTAPRTVRLRLHRLRLAPVRSPESELLATRILDLLQDSSFNPRGGSMPLQDVAEEAHRRYPTEFRAVVGGEHLGSFRAYVAAHSARFSIFHYHENEIRTRRMANVNPHDERIAIRKDIRESMPPLMPFVTNEEEVVGLIKNALRDSDSHVHVLMRQLSEHDVFRVSMAAGFSSLMHWLQRHRDKFNWSTDPRQVCTIGLVRDRSGTGDGGSGAAAAAAAEDNDHDGGGGGVDVYE